MFSKDWVEQESTSSGCVSSYESRAKGKPFKSVEDNDIKEDEDIVSEGYAVKKFLDKLIKNKNRKASVKKNIRSIKDSIKEIKKMMNNCKKNNTTKSDIKKCKQIKKGRLKKAEKYLRKANDIKKGLKKK